MFTLIPKPDALEARFAEVAAVAEAHGITHVGFLLDAPVMTSKDVDHLIVAMKRGAEMLSRIDSIPLTRQWELNA